MAAGDCQQCENIFRIDLPDNGRSKSHYQRNEDRDIVCEELSEILQSCKNSNGDKDNRDCDPPPDDALSNGFSNLD